MEPPNSLLTPPTAALTRTSNDRPVETNIQRLKDAITNRRPILGDIMQKHGEKTLYDYSQDFLDVNPSPLLDMRKQELIDTLALLIEERLGKEVAARVTKQLKKFPLVSTADHHATLDDPFWVNANLLASIPHANKADSDLSDLVVLSFASISMNNASGYPRGITYHAGSQGSNDLTRLPIFPDYMKMQVAYSARSFKKEDIERAKVTLKKSMGKTLSVERCEGILKILQDHFETPDVFASPDFNAQVTKVNYSLWPLFFHGSRKHSTKHSSASEISIPNLIYVEIETLVARLMERFHFVEKNSVLHALLFDPDWQSLAQRHFVNLPGAFAADGSWGTYFFWGLDEKGHRMRLRLINGTLSSFDNQIAIPFNAACLSAALRTKKIFPSMLLCYLTVALHYGMKCLGGFCQVHDLTVIKRAWQKILLAQDLEIEAKALEPVQTKELESGLVLSYLETAQGNLTAATGIDMILEEGDTSFDRYIELSKLVTLSETMSPLLPEMYTILYMEEEKDPMLSNLTPEDLLKKSGAFEKLWAFNKKSCARQSPHTPWAISHRI